MIYYATKIVITTILIVAISEIAKRSSFDGAVLAFILLVSVLAIVWLYIDTKDVENVSDRATSVFWLVLPLFFITLPALLKLGLHFYFSISLSIGFTVVAYMLMVVALNHYGVKL